MKRLATVYVVTIAVVLAAAGLAYSSYSRSRALSSKERHLILDTMRELAEEKVINIESEVIKADLAVFNLVDIDNLPELQRRLALARVAVSNVLILGEDLRILASGFFTRMADKTQVDRTRRFFQEEVIPALDLPKAPLNVRSYHHATYRGRTQLVAYTRMTTGDRTYYIVVDTDLSYLVGTVFPQFFGTQSKRLYQVVDSRGEIVFGFAFTGIPNAQTIEVPFSETVHKWRLRVAQKDRKALTVGRSREVADLALIGTGFCVIVFALAVLLVAVRREQRANALKSEFISNVSHELKTPLSIISMFGEMLATERTKSQTQAKEYAEIIWRESVRLSRLIDNVLDFAKLERGADVFEYAEGDIADVVKRALVLCEHRLEQANMEVEAHIADDVPGMRIDGNAITLAVLNLLDNAIKYAKDGGKVVVTLAQRANRVEFSVEDFGPGIPEEEHKLIFDRFYRARSVRLKPVRGSGIGLALVKHIAQAHQGDIQVNCPPGGGTIFTLWLPSSRLVTPERCELEDRARSE